MLDRVGIVVNVSWLSISPITGKTEMAVGVEHIVSPPLGRYRLCLSSNSQTDKP